MENAHKIYNFDCQPDVNPSSWLWSWQRKL